MGIKYWIRRSGGGSIKVLETGKSSAVKIGDGPFKWLVDGKPLEDYKRMDI